MIPLSFLLKNLLNTFILQREILKTELKQEGVLADIWREKNDEWLNYVKIFVFSSSSYARYTKANQEITTFGVKD